MTTKKKKKQTAKEDLIDSLMNDVQELSGQETLHGNAAADLFSNSEYGDEADYKPPTDADEFAAHLVSEVGSDDSDDQSDNHAVAGLWDQLKKAPAAQQPQASQALQDSQLSQSRALPSMQSRNVVIEIDDDIEDVPPTPHVNTGSKSGVAYPEGLQGYVSEDAADDKTMNLNEVQNQALRNSSAPAAAAAAPAPTSPISPKAETNFDHEKTVAVAGFANRQPLVNPEVAAKVSFGSLRGPHSGGSVYAASDATLAQSENLRLAQGRILELEKEVEKYRYENDELASAGETIRERAENLTARISAIEGEKQEIIESLQNEVMILKGNSQFKETEFAKARLKIEELEGRLKTDFKKIRVRERELENRLELVKAEKSALLRAKDENILDLKRKIDHLQSELDNYRVKVLELNKTIDMNQEQFKRTVRALRLALSNLEVKEESAVPYKKAD